MKIIKLQLILINFRGNKFNLIINNYNQTIKQRERRKT